MSKFENKNLSFWISWLSHFQTASTLQLTNWVHYLTILGYPVATLLNLSIFLVPVNAVAVVLKKTLLHLSFCNNTFAKFITNAYGLSSECNSASTIFWITAFKQELHTHCNHYNNRYNLTAQAFIFNKNGSYHIPQMQLEAQQQHEH